MQKLNDKAVYYSREYEREGNTHYHYVNLYNNDLEFLESVKVQYTNIIEQLIRVVSAEKKNDYSYAAYDLEKINNNYYLVKTNEDTSELLKASAEVMKPKEDE